MTLDEQRAKEFEALGNHLTSIEVSSGLDQLTECVERAFDAVNELEECGLISRRERVYWGEEFGAARNERLVALRLQEASHVTSS